VSFFTLSRFEGPLLDFSTQHVSSFYLLSHVRDLRELFILVSFEVSFECLWLAQGRLRGLSKVLSLFFWFFETVVDLLVLCVDMANI